MKKTVVKSIEATPGGGPKQFQSIIEDMEKDGYEFYNMSYCGDFIYGNASNTKRSLYCLFFKKDDDKS